MIQALTEDPVALAGITAGTRYLLVIPHGSCRVHIGSGAPSDRRDAFPMVANTPLAYMEVEADSGESVYVWSRETTAPVIYDEAI